LSFNPLRTQKKDNEAFLNYLYDMKNRNIRTYIGIVLIISIVLGILIHFEKFLSIFNLDTFDKGRGSRHFHDLSETAFDVFISSVVTFLAFIINYYLLKPFEKNQPIRIKSLLFSLVITVVTITILSEVLFTLKYMLITNTRPHGLHLIFIFRDILISVVVIFTVYIIKMVNDRQIILIENEKLKNENLISQYETLKKQVSPHFFFNSLTSLKELISQDPHKAEDYINHLSLVMRHTLQNNENMTQSLKDELIVMDSYLFLVKIRFEDNLRVESDINPDLRKYLLPSLSLQMLIENAIKHNEVSKRNPLIIRIETSDRQSVIVSNKIQKKRSPEQSHGTGLINLSRQYQYLAGLDISISGINDEFVVELPLLNPNRNENTDC